MLFNKYSVLQLAKCMARAMTEEPVVRPGSSPFEPATSRWEYLSGFTEWHMCWSKPATTCMKAAGNWVVIQMEKWKPEHLLGQSCLVLTKI